MIIHSPESTYSKMRVEFEAQNSEYGTAKRPYVYREYPTMMYLAGIPAGAVGAPRIIESQIAEDADAANGFASRGFRMKPQEALDAYAAQKLEEAKLAAEIEFDIAKNRVSEHAAAEIRAAQAEIDGHMPMVPETPIRRRIRTALESKAADAAEG